MNSVPKSATPADLHAPPCPLCSRPGEFQISERERFFGLRPDLVHPYFRCASCEHLFQPIVEAELLLSFYPLPYYESNRRGFRGLAGRFRERNRARAVEWRSRRGRALDVGCGRGMVLEQLRDRGWKVSGMDWNSANARAVADRLQIPVAAGPEGLASFEGESFDAVAMFHVLEHEQQPIDLLREVHRILRSDGRLVVGVPNADSTARRLFGRHWMGYDFARHRQVFSRRSLEAVLAATGFRTERMTGRISDELLDVQRSSALLLRERDVGNPLLEAAVALAACAFIAVPRLFGKYSVMYAYARKE